MTEDRLNQRLAMSDGRLMGYAEFGDRDGLAVFYFHGFPSSRLDWRLFQDEAALAQQGIRIIAPDRPGYGLSDYKRDRTILGWAEDVVELANALNIDRFPILGISGGGPYAATCAYQIGQRLTRAGIVCGMGPKDSPGMKEGVSWTLPGTLSLIRRIILYLMSMGIRRDPNKFLERSKESLAVPDRKVLAQPELADVFVGSLKEAFRNGIGAANQEAGLLARPWGFALRDISSEVHLWHGEQDLNVPISVGRFMAETIPNCKAMFSANEGHFSLPRRHMPEILEALVA
jgi:pimeloyl-ACP methyl ester carboxylesterase